MTNRKALMIRQSSATLTAGTAAVLTVSRVEFPSFRTCGTFSEITFSPDAGYIMSDHNPLEHPYTFWISKRKSVLKGKNYNDCMKDIGTVYTVQEFWKLYSFMKRPSKIDDSCDLMLVSYSYLLSGI